MPNTAFGRKFQRRFLRCDALSGKATVSRPAMSDTKFFRRTILLSLRIFPVFSTPRAAFTTARTVNEAVAAAFHLLFVYRPTTSNSNLAPVVALTLGKADVSRKSPAFITAQALPHEQIFNSTFACRQVQLFKIQY